KNALEAVEDKPEARIRIATRRLDDQDRPQLELSVADNGGGIDAALLDRLFEPYVTTKAKGTGLGLAIVKKIIEEHGGIIWAENTKGGARVATRLPLWRDEHHGEVPKEPPVALAPRPRAPAPTQTENEHECSLHSGGR
nr:hypothetical protein [Chromatiaceae bacterium]